MIRPAITASLVLALLMPGFSGCASRRHMSPNYGQSVHQAFATQAVRRQPPPAGALPAGLDPDDARMINENYRTTMAKKGTEKKTTPGIIVVNEEEAARARKSKE
jgi:hypothetical protein